MRQPNRQYSPSCSSGTHLLVRNKRITFYTLAGTCIRHGIDKLIPDFHFLHRRTNEIGLESAPVPKTTLQRKVPPSPDQYSMRESFKTYRQAQCPDEKDKHGHSTKYTQQPRYVATFHHSWAFNSPIFFPFPFGVSSPSQCPSQCPPPARFSDWVCRHASYRAKVRREPAAQNRQKAKTQPRTQPSHFCFFSFYVTFFPSAPSLDPRCPQWLVCHYLLWMSRILDAFDFFSPCLI